jgi:hypothetical protein
MKWETSIDKLENQIAAYQEVYSDYLLILRQTFPNQQQACLAAKL